jgi:hypothetical protein
MEDGDVIDAHLQQASISYFFSLSPLTRFMIAWRLLSPLLFIRLLLNIYSAPHLCRVRSFHFVL